MLNQYGILNYYLQVKSLFIGIYYLNRRQRLHFVGGRADVVVGVVVVNEGALLLVVFTTD